MSFRQGWKDSVCKRAFDPAYERWGWRKQKAYEEGRKAAVLAMVWAHTQGRTINARTPVEVLPAGVRIQFLEEVELRTKPVGAA